MFAKNKKLSIILVATLLLFSMACSTVTSLFSSQDAPELDGNVLLRDDFSDENSGWEIGEFESGTIGYGGGEYIVTSTTQGSVMWGLAGKNFSNVIIEVDAIQISGPDNDNTDYGVMCRVQDNDDGYSLNISGDGWYSVQVAVNGEFRDLIEWTESSLINRGNNAENKIRAVCDGSTIALYVNGKKLDEVQDSTFTTGDIALSATTYEVQGVEVHFDNLVVREP